MFTAVFGEQARTVAVLLRPQWGHTPWTRVESVFYPLSFLKSGPVHTTIPAGAGADASWSHWQKKTGGTKIVVRKIFLSILRVRHPS